MKNLYRNMLFLLMSHIGMISTAGASVILSEDFESGILDPRITLQTVGLNSDGSGVRNTNFFGSSSAFGFGRSNCGFSCFNNHTSSLFITFANATFVNEISFKFAELFGNWGSEGWIYLDGVQFSSSADFQGLPSNSGHADTSFTQGQFQLGLNVTQIELRVVDITNRSEIFIDDLSIHGTNLSSVPEPTIFWLIGSGLIGLIVMKKRIIKLS